MTANEMKRIRAKLAKARELTAEAHALAEKSGGYRTAYWNLQVITAQASDAMARTARDLEAMDAQDRASAEAIARQFRNEAGMDEVQKQTFRRAEERLVRAGHGLDEAGRLAREEALR